MLYSVDSGKLLPRNYVPYRSAYDAWNARLPARDRAKIMAALRKRIVGKEIETSSWIPGSDWTGTPFQPIYEKACACDQEDAAKFFGLLVWVAFQEDDETWGFGHYEKDDIPIAGLTYFRVEVTERGRAASR